MCFSIAAKNVELDPMPTHKEILGHHPGQVPLDKLYTTEIERFVLKTLNWEFDKLTVQTILETFLSSGILFADDEIKGEVKQTKIFADTTKTVELLDKYVEFFSLLCL